MVLEASAQTAGSWPHYYDSLTLFSPARYSALPHTPFGGDADRYPHRNEVVAYLAGVAERLDAEVRLNTRVESMEADDGIFLVHTTEGAALRAGGIVAATGAFANP
ncbi:NAD(P)-binding domain-containing protein [Streptomyces sp. NPDC048442]|uniref:NAD(P)-binding domain-containing protein n=1 Tax=Streptomyces sp. NPDC048442 TaxID=3154823 RepID=UPI003427E02E